MAEVDPIQALSDLIHKRLIEVATEMPLKSRRVLKEILDGIVMQLGELRTSVGELKGRLDHPSKGAKSK
jgi:hypothetical protein